MKDKFFVYKHLNTPIVGELKRIEPLFKKYFIDVNFEFIDVLQFISNGSGKKIRPLMLLLSSEIAGGYVEKVLLYGMLIETLHSASLIHDDIIDLADKRRGNDSVNQKYGNKLAVLAGDYLLSRSLSILSEQNEPELLSIYAKASENLCIGEMIEQRRKRENTGSVEKYIEIIEKKTASLFSAACEMGVVIAEGDEELIRKMSEFGRYFGIAFQLKDDLLDYLGDTVKTGKNIGVDIVQKVFTYPVISVLHDLDASELKLFNKEMNEARESKNIHKIIEYLDKRNGFQNTENKIDEYSVKCENILKSLADSEAQKTLIKLVEFNRIRNK